MKIRLIITADDYGLSQGVNDAIEECLEAGAVKSTCVLTNYSLAAQTRSMWERLPSASVGIHWNLTQGSPILPASSVPSLVDGSGEFLGSARFLGRLRRGGVKISEAVAELRAQYFEFLGICGREPDFWNTHENVHLNPFFFKRVVAFAAECKINRMRCHRRVTLSRHRGSSVYSLQHPVYWLKGMVVGYWAGWAERNGMVMPEGRLEFRGVDLLNRDGMQSLPGRIRSVSRYSFLEWAIHPAKEKKSDLFGDLQESRVREYEWFSNPVLERSFRAVGIGTTGFAVEAGLPGGGD